MTDNKVPVLRIADVWRDCPFDVFVHIYIWYWLSWTAREVVSGYVRERASDPMKTTFEWVEIIGVSEYKAEES